MMRTGCHRHMRSTAWRAREALRGGRACVPVILVNGHRNCTWAADIQRLQSRPRDDGSGSGTAGRYVTMTGGSTAHTCGSRLDGSCALFNSHSIESLELRESARTGHSPAGVRLLEGAIVIEINIPPAVECVLPRRSQPPDGNGGTRNLARH